MLGQQPMWTVQASLKQSSGTIRNSLKVALKFFMRWANEGRFSEARISENRWFWENSNIYFGFVKATWVWVLIFVLTEADTALLLTSWYHYVSKGHGAQVLKYPLSPWWHNGCYQCSQYWGLRCQTRESSDGQWSLANAWPGWLIPTQLVFFSDNLKYTGLVKSQMMCSLFQQTLSSIHTIYIEENLHAQRRLLKGETMLTNGWP